MISMNDIFGWDIIGVSHMCERVQAKTHRKKRINKKWRKRYGFKEIPWDTFYIDKFSRRIYCHPKMINKLKEMINT